VKKAGATNVPIQSYLASAGTTFSFSNLPQEQHLGSFPDRIMAWQKTVASAATA